MRGMPLSAEALYHREHNHDFVSPGPVANGVGMPVLTDVVPLDPALSGPSSAPAYFPHMNGVNSMVGHVLQQIDPRVETETYPISPGYTVGQYPQGPQGDPFAPQPQFFPGPEFGHAPDDHVEVAQKSMKRKRKKPREEKCGACRGDDSTNKNGQQELMASCSDCGRSAHPSCIGLSDIEDTIRSYPWTCTNCKQCEICQKKGRAKHLLLCDNCDRGWHMDCLDPPLDDNPEGKWFCPLCVVPSTPLDFGTEAQTALELEYRAPEIQPELQIDPMLQMDVDPSMEADIDPALREGSIASSSVPIDHRRARPKAKRRARKSVRARDRKGKGRAVIITDDEEEEEEEEAKVEHVAMIEQEEEEEEEEEEMFAPVSTPRKKASLNRRRKSTARGRRVSDTVPDDIEAPTPPLRPPKRMRLNVRSPSPPLQRQAGPGRPRVMVRLRVTQNKGKGRDEDEDEDMRKGIFDDVLNEKERDTAKTSILSGDKEKFEKARISAEAKLIPPPKIEGVDLSSLPGPSSGRFPLRSAIHQLQQQHTQALLANSIPSSPSPSTPGPSYINAKTDPSVLRIQKIRFGPYDIQTWYDAPFPEEFSNIPESRLWICEFCLKYMKSRFGAQRHRLKCKCRHPPGDEIYRDGTVSIFEVDGRKNKIYCQHLCLLSKMFLDHKSLFYDVEPFLFYVITEVDDMGARFVGYFSKEKRSSKDLNLSCIMTLPVRQRQGWGNLLIDFSYLLSRKEHKSGTPERPLSALGAIGYKKYWTLALMRYLHNAPSNPRLEDISAATAMTIEDIYTILEQLNMITVCEGPSSPVRPSPGRSVKLNRSRKSGIARRNLQKAQPADEDKASKAPFVPPSNYEICWDRNEVKQFLEEWKAKGYLTLKPEKLKWTPFLLSRADRLVTPLEDGFTMAPIDVETTPVPETEEGRDSRASLSGSATASMVAIDKVDSPSDVPLATPISDSGAEVPPDSAEDPSSPEMYKHSDVGDVTIFEDMSRQAADLGTPPSQPNTSPTPSPSPQPVARQGSWSQEPRYMTGLEALAAVADVVSKANPVDVRRRASSALMTGVNTPRPEWGQRGMSGSAASSGRPLTPSRPSADNSIRSSYGTRSRQRSKQSESNGLVLGKLTESTMKDEATPRQPRPEVTPLIVSKVEPENAPKSPPPSAERVSVESDAELAARLAREESIQRRPLRSGSNSVATTPTLTSRDTRARESTRKRHKAPSVREASPPTPISPNRPTTRRQAHVIAIETAKAGRMTRRQSSKLTVNNGDVDSLSTSSVTPKRPSAKLNGTSKTASTPTRSGRRRTSQRNEMQQARSTRSRRNQSPSEHSITTSKTSLVDEGDIDAEGESDIDAEGEADIASMNGDIDMEGQDSIVISSVKNGIYSQNDIPSDRANTKAEGATPTLTEDYTMEKDGSTALPISNIGSVTNPAPGVEIEEDDIDAEGEPDDEDAEGEPDSDICQ